MRAESKLWVELADCSGAAGEVALADDVSNATIATCKTRPWTNINQMLIKWKKQILHWNSLLIFKVCDNIFQKLLEFRI